MQSPPVANPPGARAPLPPEQIFFDEPAIDRLLGMIMTLSAEVWVLSDRMKSIESILERKDVITRSDIDSFQPDEATSQAIAADRAAFAKALMDHVISRQQSRGA
jgi:hypothetical protein